MTNTFKRILEIAVAIIIALVVFQVIGAIIFFAVRVVISLLVFGVVVAVLDSLLFRRSRISQQSQVTRRY